MTPRVVAIVQARMGSTRLPGKILRDIAGRPLLWHILHRLKGCRTLDAIAVATTIAPGDDPVEDFCRDEKILCVRGPEEDVLARFAQAAEATQADIIVRVSADAPFLDAGFIDHLVARLIETDGDYVLLEPGAVCAHEGVDPFSRRALDKLMRDAAHDPTAREHVTGYFKLHPDFVRIVHAAPVAAFAQSGTRLTVDTPDDLAFIEMLYARMEARAGEASLADLLLLLQREPRLKAMNAHVRQKKLGAASPVALIRVDGGGPLGFGHVKRGLALARALRDGEGARVLFALNGNEDAASLLREAEFETHLLKQNRQAALMTSLIEEARPGILIADARQNLPAPVLARFAAQVPVSAVIDDASDRRLAVTHAYYPPLPQVDRLCWDGGARTLRVGWEWSVLGFDATRVISTRDPGVRDARLRIVVTMGGSDPFGLTRIVADALAQLNVAIAASFVIGPGFQQPEALARRIESLSPRFAAISGVSDLSGEFAGADLAVASFGVTAYELAALGVPALYMGLSEDHVLSASAFENAGMGINLGLARNLRPEAIAKAVRALSADEIRRHDMRAACLAAIDGRGAERIAGDLAAALVETRARKRA